MKLSNYPRPKGDNGRGIHWSPGTTHPTGAELTRWVEELLRMNIKWVKLLDDGNGSSLELCRRLVDSDIMPVVRLCVTPPNPGRLSRRHEETIQRLVDAGTRYFESNQEPDLPAAWKDGRLPPDWLSVVMDQFIHDADRILELGGLPAVPAMSHGSQVNPIALIVRKGRSDLFARGAWLAVHNYALNHPLDYPNDAVNQEGAQLPRKEYEELDSWAWDEHPRQLINIWRRQGKRPGQTIEEAADGWRCFELADSMAREALGYSVPVLGTEGGVVIGWRDDRRYPRITPELHRDRTVQINDFMQTRAPDYLFTTCHWVLANYRLGHQAADWESQAWFSNWWEATFGMKDHLPVVDAARSMPSMERQMSLAESELRGIAVDQAGEGVHGVPITLLADGQPINTTSTNARGRFGFGELPGGSYEIRVEKWLDGDITVTLPAGRTENVTLQLDHGYRSALRGKAVSEGGDPLAGVAVSLKTESVSHSATTGESGAFSFEGLSEGTYELIAGRGRIRGIHLNGWNAAGMNIVIPPAPTPRFALRNRRLLDREEAAGRHIFFGYVWDEAGNPLNGITLEMGWGETAPGAPFPTAVTGSGPQKADGYYEFLNTPGQFQVRVAQRDVESDIARDLQTLNVPGRQGELISYQVDFQRVLVPAAANLSTVEIKVPGAEEDVTIQLRQNTSGKTWTAARREMEAFAVQNLGAGCYDVEIAGLGCVGAVELDGFNPGFFRFPMNSAVAVEISAKAAKGRLRLAAEDWSIEREEVISPGSSVRFSHLPAGTYHLKYLGWHSDPIVLDGRRTISLSDVDVQLPHESALEGRVLNADGEALGEQHIVLMAGAEIRGEQFTDVRGRYQFAGLPRGRYTLLAEDIGIRHAEIELDGLHPAELDLTAPIEVRPKVMEHYLLLARHSTPGPWVTLLLLRDYIRRFGPVVGFSPKEATLARRVTIIADPESVGADVEQLLLDAGCMVQRLPGESHELGQALHRALE